MPAIILPFGRISQPTQAAGIDRTNFFGARTGFCSLPGQMGGRDVVSGLFPSTNTGRSPGFNRHGVEASFTDTGGMIWPGLTPIATNVSGYTFICLAAPVSKSENDTAIFLGDESGGRFTQVNFGFNRNNQGDPAAGLLSCYEYDAGFLARAQSTAGVVDGNYHVFIATRATGSASQTLYVDGVDVSSTASASSTSFNIPASVSVSNTNTFANGRGLEDPNVFAAVINVYLSPTEVAAISKNIWQIFMPNTKRMFFASVTSTVKLYLRNTQANAIGATYYDLLTTAGSSADTGVVASTAAGTEIQLTKTSGGALVNFVTPPLSAGFTLTSADISVWAKEDSALTNVGGRARLFRREAGGTETELAGGPFDDGVEFTTSDAEYTWTADFTDTAFIAGDRLLLKLYITNIGTMIVGDATFTFNAADAATGDSFINVSPALTFSANGGTRPVKMAGRWGGYAGVGGGFAG